MGKQIDPIYSLQIIMKLFQYLTNISWDGVIIKEEMRE